MTAYLEVILPVGALARHLTTIPLNGSEVPIEEARFRTAWLEFSSPRTLFLRSFRIADKQPRIARTDIYRGIITQFYASDFWNATRAL